MSLLLVADDALQNMVAFLSSERCVCALKVVHRNFHASVGSHTPVGPVLMKILNLCPNRFDIWHGARVFYPTGERHNGRALFQQQENPNMWLWYDKGWWAVSNTQDVRDNTSGYIVVCYDKRYAVNPVDLNDGKWKVDQRVTVRLIRYVPAVVLEGDVGRAFPGAVPEHEGILGKFLKEYNGVYEPDTTPFTCGGGGVPRNNRWTMLVRKTDSDGNEVRSSEWIFLQRGRNSQGLAAFRV